MEEEKCMEWRRKRVEKQHQKEELQRNDRENFWIKSFKEKKTFEQKKWVNLKIEKPILSEKQSNEKKADVKEFMMTIDVVYDKLG